MYQNTSFEEESSNSEIIDELINQINPTIIRDSQIHNMKAKKIKLNKNNYGEEFAQVFKKVYNESTKIYEREKLPNIYKEKIFRHVTVEKGKNFRLNNDDEKLKYFPFTKGEGIQICLEKMGYLVSFINPLEINLSPINKNDINIKYTKFQVIDYSNCKKGKIKREKKRRKFKPDDIRKKIKAKFHKVLKNIINNNLIKAGSNLLFDFFPQDFISNITIKFNNIALNYSYEELIKIDLTEKLLKQEKNEIDLEKYKRNIEVLEYIDKNPKIGEFSLFNQIRNMKYWQILNAYFKSKEFEDSIIELYQKRERIRYIEEYINKALTYVNYYSTYGLCIQNKLLTKMIRNKND